MVEYTRFDYFIDLLRGIAVLLRPWPARLSEQDIAAGWQPGTFKDRWIYVRGSFRGCIHG